MTAIKKTVKTYDYANLNMVITSITAIHSIEKGNSQLSVAILEKLPDHPGVTLSDLFKGNADAVYPASFEFDLLSAVRRLSCE